MREKHSELLSLYFSRNKMPRWDLAFPPLCNMKHSSMRFNAFTKVYFIVERQLKTTRRLYGREINHCFINKNSEIK